MKNPVIARGSAFGNGSRAISLVPIRFAPTPRLGLLGIDERPQNADKYESIDVTAIAL